MKKSILLAILAALAAPMLPARAASFASAVVSYSPGTLPAGETGYTNTSAALGRPSPIVGAGSGFDNVLSPFSPHYEASQLTAVGVGGHLTLQLQNYVVIDRSAGIAEIGIWENVGVVDPAFNGTAGSPASFFGPDTAVVEVSPDNVNWYSLNNGNPILFTMPGAYYLNAGPYDPAPPASPVEGDFGKPFAGTTAGFDGKTNAQILSYFNGSAGGTWLDVNAAGSAVPANVTQIGYVRFSNPGNTDGFELDGVAINTNLTGAPVPEPGALSLLAGAAGLAAARRFRRRCAS